jgi:hypothetical protein
MESEITNMAARSAGRCLAAGQQVCTSRGAVAVDELAKGSGFEAICYDPKTQRYVTQPARARAVGRKPAVRVHTDKGRFDLTADQPVMLQNGDSRLASELTPGTRLCACEAKPELGFLVRSEDQGKERIDLAHLTEADCAVTNWHPAPSVESLGEAEVFQVEIAGAPADKSPGQIANVVAWASGPGGGVGIVVYA